MLCASFTHTTVTVALIVTSAAVVISAVQHCQAQCSLVRVQHSILLNGPSVPVVNYTIQIDSVAEAVDCLQSLPWWLSGSEHWTTVCIARVAIRLRSSRSNIGLSGLLVIVG